MNERKGMEPGPPVPTPPPPPPASRDSPLAPPLSPLNRRPFHGGLILRPSPLLPAGFCRPPTWPQFLIHLPPATLILKGT